MTVYKDFLGRLNQLIMLAETGSDLPLEQMREHLRSGWIHDDLPVWEEQLGPGLGELYEALEMSPEGDITLGYITQLHLKMVHHLALQGGPQQPPPVSERIQLLDQLERIIGRECNRPEGDGRFVRIRALKVWFTLAKGTPEGFGPACGQLHAAVHSSGRVKCGDAQIWLSEMYEYVRRQEAMRPLADEKLLELIDDAFEHLDPVPPAVGQAARSALVRTMEVRSAAMQDLRHVLWCHFDIDIMPEDVLCPDAVAKLIAKMNKPPKPKKKGKKTKAKLQAAAKASTKADKVKAPAKKAKSKQGGKKSGKKKPKKKH